jgi:LPXTG-motif cell wall-anchored protein
MLQLNHNGIKSISNTLKLDNLQHLELAGNPLKDLSGVESFKSLSTVIFERTKLTNIDQLLYLENLEVVSLFGISTLDLSPGSRAAGVVEELRARGVKVWAEASFYPEIHISDVTQTTISFSWDNMLEGDGTYTVYVNGEMQGDEPFPAEKTSYEVTGLEPDTAYYIEVFGESGEFVNTAWKEVTTLSEEEEESSAPGAEKPHQEKGEPVSSRPIKPGEIAADHELPKTATLMYQSVFFGTILMMAGAAFLAARRKRG